MAKQIPNHSFYIPVMGTGFTIDTPLFVAKYGITSVLSLVDDVLIEQMRRYWCERYGEPYEKIANADLDCRAKRITAYLNLLKKLVDRQSVQLQNEQFEPGSDITKYFEMLPNNELKQSYQCMLAEKDQRTKTDMQDCLRKKIVVGDIDVNIMTKLDGIRSENNDTTAPYGASDAASALRGFAKSDLCSFVVFSAGFNPHLYGYAAQFDDFFPDENNELKKKICLKASDYRSAFVQGKYLAKHGLWPSQIRIESALNCGGHAFVSDGQLLGPILEEFRERREEFTDSLHKVYAQALKSLNKNCSNVTRNIVLTAQGGVGTNEEHEFLIKHYNLDAVGWGTPFLLVPEATNVDDDHLKRLLEAKPENVALSESSPLGIKFWNLLTSASEDARRTRIDKGSPGSLCCKGYAKFAHPGFDKPICKSSREYQKIKLDELQNSGMPHDAKYEALKEDILSKSCICHDLAGGATIKRGIDKIATTAICPGPNIINFKKLMSLKEIVDHIYGRCSKLANNERAHVFLTEIKLQINYLQDELKKAALGFPTRSQQKLEEIKLNLSKSATYYQKIAKDVVKEQQGKFCTTLQELKEEIDSIVLSETEPTS